MISYLNKLNNLIKRLVNLRSRFINRRTRFALGLVVLVLAFLLAYSLRFDFEIPQRQVSQLWVQLPYAVLIKIFVLTWAGGLLVARSHLRISEWS